jgi:hypothetical protein
MDEMTPFCDFAGKLLGSPELGALTDYKQAQLMESTTPNISNAWSHVVPALAQ